MVGTGSIRRFGARYGRGVKLRFGVIEAEQRRYHDCPYCRTRRVKRVAVGIWQCRKCGNRFTGKAYTLGSAAKRTPTVMAEPEAEAKKAPEAA
ncbi:50S ribosomal protein L37ae [Candidatus Woesearchaeota archaeon]|nr:50S ribosomal protein L37ae [Candidatus Woesearchaeota archaeon]